MHDQLATAVPVVVPFDFDALDHGLLDAHQGAPYPGVAHAVLRSPVPDP
jgi:hypothetical protein